jgi:hypothetical protein
MNRFESSKPSCEREHDLPRRNKFHAVLLGVAERDLRQRVQVIQSTEEWLSSMLDADDDKLRMQLGEPVISRLTEQLDRLAGALSLYEDTTTMEPSPVPLSPFATAVRQKGLDLRSRPSRAMIMSNAVLLAGTVRNLVRNAIQICRRLLSRSSTATAASE